MMRIAQPEGLMTGYYEPLLTGSRQRERPGQAPLRALPPNSAWLTA